MKLTGHLTLIVRTCSTAILLISIAFTSDIAAATAPLLLPEIDKSIRIVIEHVFNDEVKSAEDEAKRLIRRFPEQPAGYFCMAFVIDAWMVRNQSNKREDEFYKFCDLTIEKGDRELRGKADSEWAKFFMAGADGFKGTYEARFERWITAFRFGWKGVSVLLDMESKGSSIPDIQYGIASYNYWRSALTKMLWWMPGIEDRREASIAILYKVSDSCIYSGILASKTLVEVLLNEKKYADALALAHKLAGVHPNYLPFTYAKAKAYLETGEFEKAASTLTTLLGRLESDQVSNHYDEIVYRGHLSRCYLEQKKYVQVISECNRIKNTPLEPAVKKRLSIMLEESAVIEKQAMKAMSGAVSK